ncbi:hypothetical protein [Acinetobacter gerneri]|jgi:sulfur relay (sulfurtransferase) DsrC/TusE family protein|uniref:hypothetical protein n=1 Tax=Acinetobacter gerneri TaxID=202952 RepID=UPI0023F1508D|nr:hypothetical protein [Acinetobacter gerneri]MCH4243051.1 hypothetical protein [Acinetobacter gerneri]
MKILRNSALIVFGLSCMSNCFALSEDWNDIVLDSIQNKKPIEYVDEYNKYIVINSKLKIKLKDFGNVSKIRNDIKYVQKKIGVQILNSNKIYNVYNDILPVNADVNMHLLYDGSIVTGVRIRKNYEINYVKSPYRVSEADAVLYSVKENKVATIKIINSTADSEGGGLDYIRGDQITYDNKNKRYTYYAEILKSDHKISKFKVVLDSSFKCVSATLGCGNVGISYGELVGVNK